jgi:hypothetical protein
MPGVLNFQQYIGGPDSVQVENIFPSNQKTLVYTFKNDAGTAVDITGWTFAADYQTIVVDEIAFNRTTNKPNFANSTVIGSFAKVEIASMSAGIYVPTVLIAANGTLKVHLPAGMYAGSIIPDARKNVPITVFSLTWTDNSTVPQVQSHRWCLVNCWEPDVTIGDPITSAGYTALTV